MKKINELKTAEGINEYYAHYQDKIRIKHNITNLEMPTINSYMREHEKLINKCGARLRKIKKTS